MMKAIIGKKTEIREVPEGESRVVYDVGEDSVLTLLLLANNRKKVAVRVTVRLGGKGAKATIVGIVIARGQADIEFHTLQHHQAPETTSNLLVKTVLSDGAICRYDGGIRVEKLAQKTDAYQRNENLLVGGQAHAESKPSLEILANDVRCTHGATVGHMDADQMWYLATRGIVGTKAQNLIVSGFITSALTIVRDEKVKKALSLHLPRGVAV